jgi:hypothetical protein
MQLLLCTDSEGGAGGALRPCLYVKGGQKFLLVTGAQGLLSLSSARRQQRDVLSSGSQYKGNGFCLAR